jgi:proline iminopeptidase
MTLDIFSEIEPFSSGWLSVDGEHALYFEECGNPAGRPAVFLHGGPGSGSGPIWRRYFDPEKYRVILFDQRGCGRSTPYASLVENTTEHLISDVDKLRAHLGIENWLVVGGSWGSTLALAYAQRHPQQVTGLILYGVFLGSKEEIDWFYQKGANFILADAWDDFVRVVPEVKREDMVESYYELLNSEDQTLQLKAAQSWSMWEAHALRLVPDAVQIADFVEAKQAVAQARIECHYFRKQCFLKPNQLIENLPKIAHIPAVLIQGRYDLVCPFKTAWTLHKHLVQSQLVVVQTSGHSAREIGTVHEIVTATNRFASN